MARLLLYLQMRMIKTIVTIMALSGLLGCNNGGNKSVPAKETLIDRETGKKDSLVAPNEMFPDDTAFHLAFVDTGTVQVKAKLRAKPTPIRFHLNIPKPVNLVAIIQPVKKDCNIRINNIIQPNDSSDGPFGRELKYKLKIKGDYVLVVGPNLMASDPMDCDFVLTIRLE